ncbi:MAG: response regulator [Candidatus Aureabacteria bacterium]|nr:response regulator [Candidatus Auribacterota bacterium]
MNKRILIVDDEEIMRSFLFDLLQDEGYDVEQCDSGEAAIERTEKRDYDLIISDIKMQGKDGYDVLKAVRTIKPDIKVLLMTGYALDEEGTEIVAKGANGFILKPFDINSIRQIAQKLLG